MTRYQVGIICQHVPLLTLAIVIDCCEEWEVRLVVGCDRERNEGEEELKV